MTPSPYQEAIFSCFEKEEHNLLVQACAGSGKTTTLKMLCDRLPRHTSALALCFNKVTAQEFGRKLPGFVDARTIHSLGFRILRENGNVVVDTNKQKALYSKMFGKPKDGPDREARKAVLQISALLRSMALETSSLAAVRFLLDEFKPDFDLMSVRDLTDKCNEFVARCREERTKVDFDDMVDHVVHYELRGSEKYDVIMGDEVQDWNQLQSEFVRLLAGTPENSSPQVSPALADLLPGIEEVRPPERPTRARLVLVGDRNQSIYAFRGADVGAMDNLKDRFRCEELPLSVSYRCPRLVVGEAQEIVGDDILPHEGSEEGKVEYRGSKRLPDTLRELPDGAMVLCRTNAPLVPAALTLIRAKRKAVIRGRDIGASLVNYVDQFSRDEEELEEVLPALCEWFDKKIQKFLRDDAAAAACPLIDQRDCILALAEDCDTATELKSRIRDIFSDDIQGVVFSSVHRAKGLENPHVVILGPENMPHPMAFKSGGEAAQQEQNLRYVAVTRSQDVLIYQELPHPGDE